MSKKSFKNQLFELENFITVQTFCKIAMDDSKFFAISGETGSGKTEALTHFKSNNFDTTIYIRLRSSMCATEFFNELASFFNYKFSYRTMYKFLNWVKLYLEKSKKKTSFNN